ncbi:ParB-like nuclease domain-containing protein [Amycolatopsis tolypomycina]|uniref:ParB-like nuclease domain-containing protein n=1 Tax=Amycolatopsis tolypomycina TaxID=208445 RepID=A0A1H4YV80_9PSEU|nr:ParB/RepB/Spo0J family partition protein [Amycolatopsis tolypomycina]SED21567.1 ParB-like nuclease domain-containing protein [Amycolatopsis tolypomycina]
MTGGTDDLARVPVESVPIDSLVRADSPRLDGENDEHIRLLAESGVAFPPILVQKSTSRVIDGMHRLRAAELRREDRIDVQYYEGDDDSSFILGVRANITHGLPLSLADRAAAATRICAVRPYLSDRTIASATGLSTKTIRSIRAQSSGENSGTAARVGRDGRVRPLSTEPGRRLAAQLMAENPDASLRAISRAAGIAVATARDVRERVRAGLSPVPENQRRADRGPNRNVVPRAGEAGNGNSPETGELTILRTLARDPSLRFSERGRALLRWLVAHTADVRGWKRFVNDIPPHCEDVLARISRMNAAAWHELAGRLERQREESADPEAGRER